MTTPIQFRPGPPVMMLPAPQRTFERKVRWSKAALLVESVWPQLWLLVGLALLFVCVSMMGLWPLLPEMAHMIVLAGFALATVGFIGSVVRTRLPDRDSAIRRLEQRSDVPHRPASTYEDTVTSAVNDPIAAHIWATHKSRMADTIARLRVGTPSARTDRRDPFALRALALLGVATLTVLAGDAASDRLAAAFRFGPLAKSLDARLDAWVTPPAYTGKAPVMLADGARGMNGLKVAGTAPTEIPANSVLYVRTSGGIKNLALEITPDVPAGSAPAKPIRIELPKPEAGVAPAKGSPVTASVIDSDTAELKAELKTSGSVRVLSGSTELARWAFAVTPDLPPKVTFTREPERTLRGSLRIPYKVEDDYGVASLEGHIARIRDPADASSNAWARPVKVKGPRPPYERPPQLSIRLPQSYAKDATGVSLHEVGDHIWAGLPVTLTLIAKDLANQTGKSEARKMVLPARQFSKPLARAVVEQRRALVDDPRQRPHVLEALDAITLAPETGITNLNIYLGLRSVYWRLHNDNSRTVRNSAIEQLWQIALKIEDGSLSDAERALKAAQDKLSKALENGATDEEIKQLMQELRQAMAKFLEELSKQAQNNPPQDSQGMEQNQTLSQKDLEQMMQNLENMARSGNRDQAQQMLSDLRDLMDRLQSGRMANQQGQGQGEGQKLMNELDELLGKEQQLLDDTFRQQNQADQGDQGDGQQGQQGQQGQRGQQGQQGQGQGQQGQGGQQGQQGNRQGQGRQPGQGQGQAPGQGQGQAQGPGLGDRQQGLRDMLGKLQNGMGQQGIEPPSQFGEAGKAMQQAEKALRDGDLDGAAEAEGRALDQLRQGARSMAEQMMKQRNQRMGQGQGGQTGPRGPLDPLGRAPSATDGSDPGTGVKVPDQIDVQRAREILEELRRRLGENTRPTFELEYLERLLQQF